MKTVWLSVVLIVGLSLRLYSQSFEGKIIYTNNYTSKIPQLSDAQLNSLMGKKQEFFIKGASYKSVVDGTYSQMQIYVPKDNRIYHKLSMSDTLYWIDATKDKDPIVRYEVKENVETILGYACDQVTVQTESGRSVYYFSKKLALDPALFKEHKYMGWSKLMEITKSLPLKWVLETPQFTVTSIATEIIPQKFSDDMFVIPPRVPTKVSPF